MRGLRLSVRSVDNREFRYSQLEAFFPHHSSFERSERGRL